MTSTLELAWHRKFLNGKLGWVLKDNRGCSGSGLTRGEAEYNYRLSVIQQQKLYAGYDIPFAGIDD